MESGRSTGYSAQWIHENKSRSVEFLSIQLDERLAAYFSVFFLRHDVSPNLVTAFGLATNLITAALILALPSDSTLPAALVAFFGWHLAYIFDCSDGQVARTANKQSPEGAVLDLLSDYLGHVLILMVVLYKVVGLESLTGDDFTPVGVALLALCCAGWFAMVHNQALSGPGRINEGLVQKGVGNRLPLRIAYQCVHLMDTSLTISVLAVAIALDGYVLLGVFVVAAGLRLLFLAAKFVGLLLISTTKKQVSVV